jgi:hypothetical protein
MKAMIHSANNPIRRPSLQCGFRLILLLFACVGLSPMAQAVVPAPDGGYPNGTTAEGTNALFSLTTGIRNTGTGFEALRQVTTGNQNTATGHRAQVDPDLVTPDRNGKPETVRYEAINAMLLNEFLKEHRKVEELKAAQEKQQAMIAQQQKDFQVTTAEQRKDFESKIAHQQKQIEALTTGLQKVSDQLELSKPAHRTVVENR